MKQPPVTKRQYVYDNLKTAIINGELHPGDRLIVNTISEAYQVSTMPVREAIKRLSDEGLVITIPNRGTRVHVWDYDEFNEVTQISLSLAQMASRLAAKNISSDGLEHLRKIMQQMNTAVEKNDVTEYYKLNHLFLTVIYKESGNQRLMKLILEHYQKIYPCIAISFHNEGRLSDSLKQHQLWLNAIECGDSSSSAYISMKLITDSFLNFLNHLEYCLEHLDDKESYYYIYGFASTFAKMSIEEIREKIQYYRSWVTYL